MSTSKSEIQAHRDIIGLYSTGHQAVPAGPHRSKEMSMLPGKRPHTINFHEEYQKSEYNATLGSHHPLTPRFLATNYKQAGYDNIRWI